MAPNNSMDSCCCTHKQLTRTKTAFPQSKRLCVAAATVHTCDSALDFDSMIAICAEGSMIGHDAPNAFIDILAVQSVSETLFGQCSFAIVIALCMP